MATLTETAYYTRKGIKGLGFGIIAFIALKILYTIFIAVWLAIFPPAPPPPNNAFGKLPKISFPVTQIASTSAAFNYSLETIDGVLSQKSQTMKIFFVPTPTPSFGAFEKMKSQANQLGFSGEPKAIPGKTNFYQFDNMSNPLHHLEYDNTTGNFRVYYDYRYDLNLFSEKNFSNQTKILTDAAAYFSNLDLFTTDLSSGDQNISYFKLDIDRLKLASSLAEADAVAVSFNKSPVVSPAQKQFNIPETSYPIISANPDKGLVSILYSGSSAQAKKVLEASYYHTTVDFENYATYSTISLAAAFENLKSGNAFIASVPGNSSKDISIRKVYLAYYDSETFQNYLQPVAVFSDEKGFVAYVPAINSIWTE